MLQYLFYILRFHAFLSLPTFKPGRESTTICCVVCLVAQQISMCPTIAIWEPYKMFLIENTVFTHLEECCCKLLQEFHIM